jgi:DNA helicase-2/ATP-dependent DNA helicase PcrA
VSPVPRAWAAAVCELQELVPKLGVEDLLFEAMERTRQLEALLDVAGPDPGLIAANVSRFAELVADFCARRSDHSLAAFLDHLELVLLSGAGEEVAEPEPGDQEAVQVMTIHQAKGLEFEAVFVPALVEGRLPQAAWRDSLELPAAVLEPSIRAREDHVAEERRLLYVAMTRARSRLFLSWAERYEGSRRWRPSRFLAEVESAAIVVDRTSPPALDSSVELVAPVAPVAPVGRVSRASHGPGAKAPADEIPILSFSAVASYRECPRQYWYKHALRLPAEQSAEAQLGSAVHQALMWAGALRRDGKQLSKDTLHDLYRRGWSHGPCSDERRRPVLEAIGWRQLKGYLDAGGLAARPYLVEHSFTADLDGWRLRGIIDRVDAPPPTQGGEVGSNGERANSGAWKIVDYKTGSPLPAARLRRDLQLALYALGAKEGLRLDPVELEIVYLKTGQRVTVPATEELLQDARQAADEVAAGVRAGRFEARPQPRRCRLCPYRLACPDAL